MISYEEIISVACTLAILKDGGTKFSKSTEWAIDILAENSEATLPLTKESYDYFYEFIRLAEFPEFRDLSTFDEVYEAIKQARESENEQG